MACFCRSFVVLLLLALPLGAQARDRSARHAGRQERVKQERAAVRALLDAQVEAWNRGDLAGYMSGYWKSEQLTFFSGGTVTHGWDATFERYQKRYQSGGASMGKLDFAELEIVPLGPQSAMARGRFHLLMPDGKEPRGLFTVILRKFPEGWRIVHDHSSAE